MVRQRTSPSVERNSVIGARLSFKQLLVRMGVLSYTPCLQATQIGFSSRSPSPHSSPHLELNINGWGLSHACRLYEASLKGSDCVGSLQLAVASEGSLHYSKTDIWSKDLPEANSCKQPCTKFSFPVPTAVRTLTCPRSWFPSKTASSTWWWPRHTHLSAEYSNLASISASVSSDSCDEGRDQFEHLCVAQNLKEPARLHIPTMKTCPDTAFQDGVPWLGVRLCVAKSRFGAGSSSRPSRPSTKAVRSLCSAAVYLPRTECQASSAADRLVTFLSKTELGLHAGDWPGSRRPRDGWAPFFLSSRARGRLWCTGASGRRLG